MVWSSEGPLMHVRTCAGYGIFRYPNMDTYEGCQNPPFFSCA